MILASTIVNQLFARLDASGSQRYTFDQDFVFAINSAIDTIVSTCNAGYADGKLKPEALRDLTKTKVWLTNSYSRVAFDSSAVGHEMWTLLAVYPKIKTNRSAAFASPEKTSASSFRPDISFVESGKAAKRLTVEQWNENRDNAFMVGNDLLAGTLQEYAYLDWSNYNSTSYTSANNEPEIEIRPSIPKQFVALTYNKYPNRVTGINDLIEFPKSLTELMIEFSLNFIAFKQGEVQLAVIDNQMINRLVGLLNGAR